MSFLQQALEAKPDTENKTEGTETTTQTTEDQKQGEGEGDKTTTSTTTETQNTTSTESTTETSKEADKTTEAQTEKVKIDYKEWLQTNEGDLYTYLKEKNTDYTKLAHSTLVEMQLKKANPHLSDEDIKEELADKYGIGLQKLSENIDDYADEAELKEAKAYNKQLDKLSRQLKKDAPLIAKEFEDYKQTLNLPEFEFELPKIEKGKEKTQEEFLEEITKQTTEYRDTQWVPQLKETLNSFESIQEEVEYEDNGNKVVLKVDYKLSDTDKEELLSELQDYVVTTKDQERYADLDGFLKAKAPEKYYGKLLKTVAKEAAAKARQDFVKNDLLNYDDSGKKQSHVTKETDFATAFFARNKQNKL